MIPSPTNSILHKAGCRCDACWGSPLWLPDTLVPLNVNTDVLLQQGLQRLYKRKIAEGSTDIAFTRYNQDQLWEAVLSGWQGKPQNLKYGSPQHELLLNLRHNTQVFSIFKVHDMCNTIHGELFDAQGNLRSFNDFRKAVLPILKDYSVNWLQAEYQTAQGSARMAQKWKQFEAKGTNGKLVYKTIGDDRVRDEHRLLEGTTRSMTDPFWNTWYPPNGYRCRCYVRWVPGDTPDQQPQGLPEISPLFRINVGKLGVALPPDHPYYQVDAARAGAILASFSILATALDSQAIARNLALFAEYSANAELVPFYNNIESGGFVFEHIRPDPNSKYRLQNQVAARKLADKGIAVMIREHVEIDNIKNPEFLLNGSILSDLKTPESTSGRSNLSNQFEKAVKQNLSHVTVDIDIYPQLNHEVSFRLNRAFRLNDQIQVATLIHKNKVFDISRRDYEARKIAEIINKKALDQ